MLDATGLPPQCVLAVRMGATCRQTSLEVNRTFTLPGVSKMCQGVEVSLYQHLASQSIHVLDSKAEETCYIPVRRPDGVVSKVALEVKRGHTVTAAEQAASAEDDVEATRAYLERHGLQVQVQRLIQDVLKELPDEPCKYMLQLLKKTRPQADEVPLEAPALENNEEEKEEVAKRVVASNAEEESTPGESPAEDQVLKLAPKPPSERPVRPGVRCLGRFKSSNKVDEDGDDDVPRTIAKQMSSAIVGSAVSKATKHSRPRESTTRPLKRFATQHLLGLDLREQALAMTLVTCYMAYVGAARLLGESEERRSSNLVQPPTPIVALQPHTWK